MRIAHIVLIAVMTALLPSAVRRVTAQGEPAFDVASIRRNVSGDQQGGGLAGPQPGGRFIAIGATLRRLVGDAYSAWGVEGGPAWVATDRFDINARAEGDRPPAEIARMLRTLLIDRFKLAVHTETREMAVYHLTRARADGLGPKLRQSDATCAEEAEKLFPTLGVSPQCGDFRLGARTLVARGMSMAALARLLGGRADRVGLDRTGLDGVFDLELEWFSDLGLRPAPPGSAGAGELTPDGLSLFTAVQEQLGLRLEPGRGPVEVVIIDRAEPPTPD